ATRRTFIPVQRSHASTGRGNSWPHGQGGAWRDEFAYLRKPEETMTQDSPTYWKNARTEVRAAGFDPDRAARTNAVITIASAYTNAHRCNNRVRQITDLLVDLIAERGGTGL